MMFLGRACMAHLLGAWPLELASGSRPFQFHQSDFFGSVRVKKKSLCVCADIVISIALCVRSSNNH